MGESKRRQRLRMDAPPNAPLYPDYGTLLAAGFRQTCLNGDEWNRVVWGAYAFLAAPPTLAEDHVEVTVIIGKASAPDALYKATVVVPRNEGEQLITDCLRLPARMRARPIVFVAAVLDPMPRTDFVTGRSIHLLRGRVGCTDEIPAAERIGPLIDMNAEADSVIRPEDIGQP